MKKKVRTIQSKYISHINKYNTIMKTVIEGKVEGKISKRIIVLQIGGYIMLIVGLNLAGCFVNESLGGSL